MMFTQGGLTTPKGPAAVRAPSSALSASKQERLEALRNERLRIMQAQASLLARPRSVGRSAAGTPFGRSLASPPPSQATAHLEEIEKLKSEIRQLKINEELAKEKIVELEAALRRHRAEDGSSSEAITRLKQQLTREKDRVFTLATEKQRLEEELQETKIEKFRNEQLENEVQALKHQVTEAGRWREERETLKQHIETMKKDGEIVRNQYKTEKSQRLVLAAKVEQLEKELRFDRRPTAVLAAETIGVVTWKGPSPKHAATGVSPHSDAAASARLLPGIESRRPTHEAPHPKPSHESPIRPKPSHESPMDSAAEARRPKPSHESPMASAGEYLIEPSSHILVPEPQGGGSSSRASSHRSAHVEPNNGSSYHGSHVEPNQAVLSSRGSHVEHVLSSHSGAQPSHRALDVDEYHVESKRDSSPFAARVEPRHVSFSHGGHGESKHVSSYHGTQVEQVVSSHDAHVEPREVFHEDLGIGGRGGNVKKIASFVDPFAAGEDEYVDDYAGRETSGPRGEVDPFATSGEAADEMMETPMKSNHGFEKRPSEVSFVDVEQRGSAKKESTVAAPPDISSIFGGPPDQEQRVASIPEHTETHQWRNSWETTQRSWDNQRQQQHSEGKPQFQPQQQWEGQHQPQQQWEGQAQAQHQQQQWEVKQHQVQQQWEGQAPLQQPQVQHQQQWEVKQTQVQQQWGGQGPLQQPRVQHTQSWETRSQPPQQWTPKPAPEQTQPVQNWGGPSPTNQQQWYNPVVLQPTNSSHPVMKQTIPGRPSPSTSPKAPPMQSQAPPQTHASQHPAFARPQIGQAPIAPVGTQSMQPIYPPQPPQVNQGYMHGAPPPQFRQAGQSQGPFRY